MRGNEMKIMLNFVLLKHWAGHVHLIIINVLGSSSIWMCQILNNCTFFLQAGTLEKIKTNIQDSKFNPSKSKNYQGHKGPSINYVVSVAFLN